MLRKSGQRGGETYVGAEDILKNTYGILFIYQEQILKMCQVLGGIPAEDSDTVRKALGKRDRSILEKFGGLFVENYLQESLKLKEKVRKEGVVRYGKIIFISI